MNTFLPHTLPSEKQKNKTYVTYHLVCYWTLCKSKNGECNIRNRNVSFRLEWQSNLGRKRSLWVFNPKQNNFEFISNCSRLCLVKLLVPLPLDPFAYPSIGLTGLCWCPPHTRETQTGHTAPARHCLTLAKHRGTTTFLNLLVNPLSKCILCWDLKENSTAHTWRCRTGKETFSCCLENLLAQPHHPLAFASGVLPSRS